MPDSSKPNLTRQIVISALLLSIAVVVNFYSVDLNVGGVPIVRIAFGGPFLNFIPLLFGPIFGGAAHALNDVIGYLLNPRGAYMWPLTILEFCKGFFVGLLWFKIKKINFKVYNRVYLSICAAAGIIGLANLIIFNLFPGSAYAEALMSIGTSYKMTSIGLAVFAFAALLLYLPALFIFKRKNNAALFERYLKLVVCVGVPGLLRSTVNTYILRLFFLIPDRAFILLWTPRIIKEMIMIVFYVYILMILTNVYNRAVARAGNRA